MSIWERRDLPVLRWLNENPPYVGMLETNWVSEDKHPDFEHLTQADVDVAVQTLGDAGYVTWRDEGRDGGGGCHRLDFLVTGRGKQVLGEWPRFDALGESGELAAILERLAELAPTDEEASNYRKTAGLLRRGGTFALGAALKGALGVAVRQTLG